MAKRVTILLAYLSAASAFHLNAATPKLQRPPRCRPAQASVLTTVGSGLFLAGGSLAWVAPVTNLKNYGIKSDGDQPSSAEGMMRVAGAWQLCFAAVLLTGARGAAFASGCGLLAASLTNLAVVPVWDAFERSKSSMVFACALFAVLGKATLGGKLSPFIGAAIYSLLGILIYLTPKETAELYQVSKPMSALGYSMLASSGSAMLMTGAYLATLASGFSALRGLAVAFIINAVVAAKWALTEATGLGAPKTGGIAWAAISLVLSALALK